MGWKILEKLVLVLAGFASGALILIVLGVFPWKVFLVQSGSMSPLMEVGDLIFVKPDREVRVGSVVTYYDENQRVVTHRVVGVEKMGQWQTKGDANDGKDRKSVDEKSIIGEVDMVIPKAGYLSERIKTLPGLLFGIGLPAVYLMTSEVKAINKKRENAEYGL